MRLVLCWAGISGYMAACWRALAATDGVDLHVFAFDVGRLSFDPEIVRGLQIDLLSPEQRDDFDAIKSRVRDLKPDVLYTSGWSHAPYRHLMADREFDRTVKWLGVDTPWRGDLRQQIGRLKLRSFLRRIDRVFVPGERAWQYMRIAGMPEARISRGLYGVDYQALSVLHEQRLQLPGGWPRRFLFVGRYVQEKGIESLAAAYAKYRASISDPWTLGCCGGGNLSHLLRDRAGIEDLGFIQPGSMAAVLRQHGAFVLASEYDPWPLVIVEAAAAGLPVLCTEACGSCVELVRPQYNGIITATGDAGGLAAGIRWMHEHHGDLPAMGRRGCDLAAAYSAQMWATRWAQAARETLAGR